MYSMSEVMQAVSLASKAVRESCFEIINQRDDIIRELIADKTCIKCRLVHETHPELIL